MLSISSKGSYGLAAIFELAYNYNRGPIQIRTISENQGIPQQYLEQILIKLKQSGIVKSYRGAQGGYALIKNPSEIKVYDVLENLEGPVKLVNSPGNSDVLKLYWERTEEMVVKLFEMTIQELVLEHNRYLERIEYSI